MRMEVVKVPVLRTVISTYTQGFYADGKTPRKSTRYAGTFPGNRSLEITFTCDLRG